MLKNFWTPPRFEDAEQDRRAAQVYFILRPLLVVSLLTGGVYLGLVDGSGASLAWLGTYIALLVASLLCARGGHLSLASALLPFALLFIGAGNTLRAGGITGTMPLILSNAVIVAGLLLGRRGLWVFGGVTALTLLGLGLCEELWPQRFPVSPPSVLTSVIVLVGVMLVSTLLVRSAIRELRRALASARVREEELAALMSDLPDAVVVLALDGRILRANPVAQRMAGLTREKDIVGRRVQDLTVLPPERFDEYQGYFDEWVQGSPLPFEFTSPDAEGVPLEYEAHPRRIEFADGSVVVQVVMRETTRQRRLEGERRALDERMAEARRLESLGRLAGGVAHDFRNILTVVLANAELLERMVNLPPAVREMVREVEDAGRRAAGLTQQLLAFARRQSFEPKILSLSLVVKDVHRLLPRLLREDISVELVVAPDAETRVRADPAQLEQVLVNLVVNARDAMPEGGRLSLSVRRRMVGAGELGAVEPGAWVELVASDTGVGMSAETRERIFEPFFTTKEVGSGTGLGLATVHGIVRQSGGHLFVESEPGRGSTFRILLPEAVGTIEAMRAPRRTRAMPPATQATVLVVDDEPLVRTTLRRVLEAGGYTVLSAADGAEALELARSYQPRIDLLVTDLVMPRIAGHALAKTLKQERPGLRVVYVSGWSERLPAQSSIEPGEELLEKPFTPEALLELVAKALSTAGVTPAQGSPPVARP